MLESLKVLIFCLKDKFGLLLGILKPNLPPPSLPTPPNKMAVHTHAKQYLALYFWH